MFCQNCGAVGRATVGHHVKREEVDRSWQLWQFVDLAVCLAAEDQHALVRVDLLCSRIFTGLLPLEILVENHEIWKMIRVSKSQSRGQSPAPSRRDRRLHAA